MKNKISTAKRPNVVREESGAYILFIFTDRIESLQSVAPETSVANVVSGADQCAHVKKIFNHR